MWKGRVILVSGKLVKWGVILAVGLTVLGFILFDWFDESGGIDVTGHDDHLETLMPNEEHVEAVYINRHESHLSKSVDEAFADFEISDLLRVNVDRLVRDVAIAESFFTPALTWDSGTGYDVARLNMIDALGEDSLFVSTFMPENGSIGEFNYIDLNGLNSRLVSMDVRQVGSDGFDRYRYIAFAVLSVTSQAPFAAGVAVGTATRVVVLDFIVSGGGLIIRADGHISVDR